MFAIGSGDAFKSDLALFSMFSAKNSVDFKIFKERLAFYRAKLTENAKIGARAKKRKNAFPKSIRFSQVDNSFPKSIMFSQVDRARKNSR
jgi:hypothetical protein